MSTATRGSVAIVGVAESDLGTVAAGLSATDLMAQATRRALDDCGLALEDIDAVFAATSQARMASLSLCEYLGLAPRIQDATNVGGSSFMFHLAHAHAALEAKMCDVALIAYGSTQRSVGRQNLSTPEFNPYESPFRPVLPVTGYALAASRHMAEFGTTREQLAKVAVAARSWALMNPQAFEKEPLSIADVLASRMVSDPLTVRDCCLVTDGGGAVILTRADRAQALAKRPAFVLGTGATSTHMRVSAMPNLTVTGAKRSGELAFAMAKLAVSDIDVAELYDAFTINTILFLEDLGFCPKGEGGRFVQDGAIAPGGALPVNTNGGGLSYCHPGMYGIFLLIEATRQLRGECGKRQVEGCEVALAHGNGGVLSSQATVILGSQTTV
ncbi:MAG: thiolase [Hyphomicrobiales bacterium]|nr:thiolase [Hyphomicrobiales bacterium]